MHETSFTSTEQEFFRELLKDPEIKKKYLEFLKRKNEKKIS